MEIAWGEDFDYFEHVERLREEEKEEVTISPSVPTPREELKEVEVEAPRCIVKFDELKRLIEEVEKEAFEEAKEELKRHEEELKRLEEELSRTPEVVHWKQIYRTCPRLQYDADEPFCEVVDDEEFQYCNPAKLEEREGKLYCPVAGKYVASAYVRNPKYYKLLERIASLKEVMRKERERIERGEIVPNLEAVLNELRRRCNYVEPDKPLKHVFSVVPPSEVIRRDSQELAVFLDGNDVIAVELTRRFFDEYIYNYLVAPIDDERLKPFVEKAIYLTLQKMEYDFPTYRDSLPILVDLVKRYDLDIDLKAEVKNVIEAAFEEAMKLKERSKYRARDRLKGLLDFMDEYGYKFEDLYKRIEEEYEKLRREIEEEERREEEEKRRELERRRKALEEMVGKLVEEIKRELGKVGEKLDVNYDINEELKRAIVVVGLKDYLKRDQFDKYVSTMKRKGFKWSPREYRWVKRLELT